MDLIQITNELNKKEKLREQLLGRKSILVEGLKEMGFATLDEAKKTLIEKEKNVIKMTAHYKKGEDTFKKKYASLLGELWKS